MPKYKVSMDCSEVCIVEAKDHEEADDLCWHNEDLWVRSCGEETSVAEMTNE